MGMYAAAGTPRNGAVKPKRVRKKSRAGMAVQAAVHRVPKKLVVIIAAVLAVVLAGGGAWYWFARKADNDKGIYGDFHYPSVLMTGKYDVQAPRFNLDWWTCFPVPEGSNRDNVHEAGRVFIDAALTNEYPTVYNDDTRGGAGLYADASRPTDDLTLKSQIYFHNPDRTLEYDGSKNRPDEKHYELYRFFGSGGYYHVQYVDKHNKKLDKPKVTYFTVKDDVSLPAATGISAKIDDKGFLHVSWNPVQGASSYQVFLQARDLSEKGDGDTYVTTMRITKETKADFTEAESSADEESTFYQNKMFRSGILVDSSVNAENVYNNRLRAKGGDQSITEDMVADYVADRNTVKDVSIIVRAVKEASGDKKAEYAPLAYLNINSLLPQIPVASFTPESGYSKTTPMSHDTVKEHLTKYVSMADGSLTQGLKVLDFSKAQAYGNPDTQVITFWEVPYTVKGTILSGVVGFRHAEWSSLEDAQKSVDQATAQLVASWPKTSELTPYTPDKNVDWHEMTKNNTVATSMPDIDKELPGIKVSGSNELVKYIAANLLVGHRVMDVSAYVNVNEADTLVQDAYREAVFQNPLLCGFQASPDIHVDGSKVLLGVQYNSSVDELKTVDAFKKTRDGVMDLVHRYQKSAPSNPADQVKYYHDALANLVDYDYDAKESGRYMVQAVDSSVLVLLSADGKADMGNKTVCAGYAQAYQLLLQQAGIDSWYVVGLIGDTTGDSGSTRSHAWNLVNVGNGYKVVDVTWDDPEGEAPETDYLMADVNGSGEVGRRVYEDHYLPAGKLKTMVPESRIS